MDTTRLQRLSRAYMESAAFIAAVELKLFTAVAGGDDTEAHLAGRLGLTAVNTERLVTACVALRLLERDGDRLRNAPDVDRYLVAGRPGHAAPWMLFTRRNWNEWGRLAEPPRRREPPAVLGKYVDFTIEDARRYHEATASIGFGAGRRFARLGGPGGRTKLR